MHNLDFNIVHQNLDLYLIPKPRLISFTKIQIKAYTKTQIDIAYQNPRFISHTKTQILIPYTKTYIVRHNLDFNIVHQNLDLYLIPKPRLISFTKIQIKAYTKYRTPNLDQINILYQNLLPIPKPKSRFISHTKTQILIPYTKTYIVIPKPRINILYQNLD